MLSRKKYQSYKEYSKDDYINEFSNMPINRDRKYMIRQMIPVFDYIDKFGILEIKNFCKIFRMYGLKSADVMKFILEVINQVEFIEKAPKFSWIRKRELRKSNFNDKNAILTRLAHEYEDSIINILSSFLTKNYNYLNIKESFIKDFSNLMKKNAKSINRTVAIPPILQSQKLEAAANPILDDSNFCFCEQNDEKFEESIL